MEIRKFKGLPAWTELLEILLCVLYEREFLAHPYFESTDSMIHQNLFRHFIKILKANDFPIGLYGGRQKRANYNTSLWEKLSFQKFL